MELRVDRRERACVQTELVEWVPSPEPGVERRLLERDGGEIARATSIVRYAPGSRFFEHEHAMGEEFLVLEGEFRDEHGRYPRGTYVRNPWGSRHAPFSETGCTLFAKLRQMRADDAQRLVVLDALDVGAGQGARRRVLHVTPAESVAIVRYGPGTLDVEHAHPDGEEVLVLEGSFEDEHGVYPRGTWLRQPPGSRHTPGSNDGCLLFVKRGP